MNELVNYQSEAINLANLTESSKQQTVVLAAKTGAALLQVKELLPHGEYLPWVEANMPISSRQSSKYIRLATEKPELLLNGSPGTHLDINSELKLLSLDDDTAEDVREFAKEHELTRKEIATLTNKLNDKTREASEWRQEKFDHRNEARRLAQELKELRETKKEIIYVDDGEKALEQYKEETEGKIKYLKELAKDSHDKLKIIKAEKQQAINDGVNKKLDDHKSRIHDLQKQETQLTNSMYPL